MMRILVVEDDPDLGDAVQRRLKQEGYAVDLETNGEEASDLLAYQSYDLICLDLSLPGADGFTVLRNLRARGNATPVLVLTARSGIEDRVGTLDLGADDYLAKPFDLREFEARCRALLRRRQGIASGVTVIGRLTFDRTARAVKIDDKPVMLRNREYRLLEIFVGNIGGALSKERIAAKMFDFDDDAGINAIEVYVGRLRKKVGGAIDIRTIYGFGYVAEPVT